MFHYSKIYNLKRPIFTVFACIHVRIHIFPFEPSHPYNQISHFNFCQPHSSLNQEFRSTYTKNSLTYCAGILAAWRVYKKMMMIVWGTILREG